MVIAKNERGEENRQILDIVLKQQILGCLIYHSAPRSCSLGNRKHAKEKMLGCLKKYTQGGKKGGERKKRKPEEREVKDICKFN